jgi:nucleotide-binding universal stress UspA family protein
MTIVVGLPPDIRNTGALHLAAMLARSARDDLIICAVVPTPWAPSPARVDAEYRAELEREANKALAEAERMMPDDVATSPLVHHARSAPAGLLEVADQRQASLIVVGSSDAAGFGQVIPGSVGGRLMHSSPIPVALPPRGYRRKLADRVARVSAAYGGAEGADELVVAAAAVAAGVGASLRIVSFAVRAKPPYTSGVGTEADEAMVEQWVREIGEAGRAALERVGHLPGVPPQLEAEIGHGRSWEEALGDVDWQDGDVLVVGSSSMGPVARVFLGSRASKIVRSSPVPVVAVPRGTAAELAERAADAPATDPA